MNRAVFLDRDGVLNIPIFRDGRSYPPPTLEAFRLCEGAASACADLHAAGLLLVVVTNQPDVATGKQTPAVVDAMHARLRAQLPLTDIFACFHTDAHGCACRKPKPGMLKEAALRYDIDLQHSFLVGDRRGDIGAGQAVNACCYFIDYGYAEPSPEGAFVRVPDLRGAADHILTRLASSHAQQ